MAATRDMPKSIKATLPHPKQSARAAALKYVDDSQPGYTRRKSGKGFVYLRPDGRIVRDPKVVRRIRALVIPPAWTDVWICLHENGHIQATGHDARRRKQYRYHDRWRAVRDETKYERMIEFGRTLSKIRARVRRDLRLPGLPREKVLAAVVRLMDQTAIRIGNEEYARENRSFGLTTMEDRHVKVNGDSIQFRFTGKSGKPHAVETNDARLARIIRRCRDLPGQRLFQYLDDDGKRREVGSSDVNDYLREATGADFTAKDFRTWAGTLCAAAAIGPTELPTTQTAIKRGLVKIVETVAEQLGNTVAVCRKCYIHPRVLEAYSDAALRAKLVVTGRPPSKSGTRALKNLEVRLLCLLKTKVTSSPKKAA
jgi:DNA topoisomerase-1